MFLFVGCGGSTTTETTTGVTTQDNTTASTTVTENSDQVAPVVTVNQDTIIIQTDSSFDYAGYVTVSDNVTAVEDLVIEVSDWGSFDVAVEGTYTITIKVTDEAGNFTTANLNVVVKNDILAPMLTGSVSTVTHLAGEVVDLTKGLTGVDNVDGTNVTFTVSDYSDYNKDVPGTYTIKIVLSDAAGNTSAPINRTIVVEESYARVEMTSFDGDIVRYQALYNPQIMNGNTGTGYNSAYNGLYVNVLSKDYLEWIIEYAPERLGSGVGWSVIAVTDENDEIVYVRHWNSGEAYLDSEGELQSVLAEDWSTGSSRSWSVMVGDQTVPMTNARYSSGEMGLMLANINQWVPEDGHVFIFLNWTDAALEEGSIVAKANTPDMPRSMGANYIMNSDEDGDEIRDYALGRKLEILDLELSDQTVRTSFDAENPFPIITIPSIRYVATGGIWKNRYEQTIYLNEYTTENPYNPLTGIVANDGLGNDITDQVTYKIYRYQTAQIVYGIHASLPITDPKWAELSDQPWVLSENEVTLEQALTPENNGIYFVVEYQVTANGHTDTAYNLIKVAVQAPDYIELYGESDTVYSQVMGVEQRLEMNPDLVQFGPFNQTDRGILYEADFFNALAEKPVLTEGVIVVLNKYYQIQTLRIANGTYIELDGNGESVAVTFDTTHLLDGITVPADGYLLIYPAGLDNKVLDKAVKAFYDYDYLGDHTDMDYINGLVRVSLVIKEVQEVSTLKVDGETATITVTGVTSNVEVITNDKKALIHDPALGGAGFRQGSGKVYLYNDDMYEAFLSDSQVVDSFTNIASNLGVPWFNNGVVMIFDATGEFVLARLGVGAAAEVHADGTFLFGSAITNWDVTVYTVDNLKVHGLLANILDDVPEGGYFMIFPTTGVTAEVRNLAISLVWNTAYPGGGAIVDVNADPAPTNPETLGFDATTFTATYFADLSITSDYVATIVDKAAKIARPNLTIDGNILSWTADAKAASYDVYYNGVLMGQAVGTLGEDTVTYTLDLATILAEEGTYDIQLRAITADGAVASTSVLSDPVSFTVARLAVPTNFVRTDNILAWDPVTGATKYYVSINEAEYIEVTDPQVVLPDADIINGVVVKVYAAGSDTLFDSLVAEHTLVVEVIPMEVVMGSYVMPIKEFIVPSWMRYVEAGDVGAQWIEAFVVVNNAEGFLELDDATRVFAGGYAVVLDSENNIKYIVDRWGHEWNATDGWTTNAEGWTFGANFYVSYFRPYLATGDTILFASQYTTGLEEGTWRNYFGNALIYDLGVNTTDHRNVDLAQAIDPTTIDLVIREQVTTKTISLGINDLPLVSFDFDAWINYIDPAGSNDIGAANIYGIVMVEGANGIQALDDTKSIFAGGYAVLLDSEMNIKYIVDRWGHEWNATDGWTTNAGGWTYGANLLASYFKPYLAEGDILILASQYANGLPAGNYRNYLGNAVIKDLGSVTPASDHRSVDLATAVDPTTVVITIKETTTVLKLGRAVLDYREFDFDNWMLYAQSDPGADGIYGLVYVTGVEKISTYADTDRIFAGGTVILLDSEMNVKLIVDRWSNKWTQADGWTKVDTNWAYGANIYVSYVSSLVETGDILIFAGQYARGLTTGASYRDVVGNQILSDIGTAIYTGDHRGVTDLTTAIDPTTVTIEVVDLTE
jgi:hypothetical protein